MVFYLVQILCCKWSKTASPWDGNWLYWTSCAADFQPHQITPLSSMCIPKCPLFMLNCALKKERKEIRCCHGMNYGVTSSSSCFLILIWAPRELGPPKDWCLLSKLKPLNGCGQTGLHLSPIRASPYVPMWLLGNIQFTWIILLWMGGP